MKANGAPEKLYLTPLECWAASYQSKEDNSIEYTRTDAFVEKAVEWLKENITNNTTATQVISRKGCVTMGMLIKDFRKYMEEE